MPRVLMLLTLAAFGTLSALALWHHGYWGLFQPLLMTLAGGQVLADLVIALMLVMIWMVNDARKTGRRSWPWVALTLAAGSLGPLLYLLTRRTPDQQMR